MLMTNDLMARAARQSRAEKLQRYPKLSTEAGKLAQAVGVLLEVLDSGQPLSVERVWTAIEGKVSRQELRAAVAHLAQVAPPADAKPGGEWRTALVERFASVRAFVPLPATSIEFGATTDAAVVLAAMRELPGLLERRATKKVPAGYLDEDQVAGEVVPAGWWQRLVFPVDRPAGTVDRGAYVFCVLEQFYRHLVRRDIYATASVRWNDPRAQLLASSERCSFDVYGNIAATEPDVHHLVAETTLGLDVVASGDAKDVTFEPFPTRAQIKSVAVTTPEPNVNSAGKVTLRIANADEGPAYGYGLYLEARDMAVRQTQVELRRRLLAVRTFGLRCGVWRRPAISR